MHNEFMWFTLPLTDPILIFSLVLFIIFLTNSLLSRTPIPGIMGMILAGMAVGPHGLNLLSRDGGITLFGTVGLLYIMFLAGLEIDFNQFRRSVFRSGVFGFLTFLIPMGLGTFTGIFVLGLSWPAAILLASMFASHTLIAYPVVSKLGLTRSSIVGITVGGTIITDTLALLVLAIIVNSTHGDLDTWFWIRLVGSFGIFVGLVLFGIPRLAGRFFRKADDDSVMHYIFVLAMVFLAAFLAQLTGFEPIIGAFLAGLALNRLVPSGSILMSRIEFVGNALFIPFFLIGVGMLVDLRVLFYGWESLFVGGVMSVVAVSAKWLAAFLTQKIFRFSSIERNLMFGLSNAQAAATLAAVMIAYDIGLFGVSILNGTILMILSTCVISSFAVQASGRELAVMESSRSLLDIVDVPQRILVPIANPQNIERLLDLAIMIQDVRSEEPIFPLLVVNEEKTKEKIVANRTNLLKAIRYTSAAEKRVHVVSSVDNSVSSGVLRAVKELLATEVIIGWNGQVSDREKIFGPILDEIIDQSRVMLLISKIQVPLNVIKKLKVVVPALADREFGFQHAVMVIHALARQAGARIHLCGPAEVLEKTRSLSHRLFPNHDVDLRISELSLIQTMPNVLEEEDLLVVISSRQNEVSFQPDMNRIPRVLKEQYSVGNLVVIYPEP